jgi:hypothetical protein
VFEFVDKGLDVRGPVQLRLRSGGSHYLASFEGWSEPSMRDAEARLTWCRLVRQCLVLLMALEGLYSRVVLVVVQAV